MKSNVVRVLAAATLAGAVLAVAPAAQAQQFGVGVRFGGPRYFAPPPPPVRFYGYGYDHRRFEEHRWEYRHDGFRHDWR